MISYDDSKGRILMSTLILLVGLPGTGKSSWIKDNASNFLVVSSEEIRECLFGRVKNDSNKTTVEAYKRDIIKSSLEYGQNVVVDDYNLSASERLKILRDAPIDTVKKAVYFTPNMNKLLRRFKNSHDITEEVLNKMSSNTDIPTKSEGYESITII